MSKELSEPAKFRPTVRSILVLISGVLMFITLNYSFWQLPQVNEGVAETLIRYLVQGFFIILLAMSIHYLFKIKTIETNESGLTVRYLVQFRKVNIPYDS